MNADMLNRGTEYPPPLSLSYVVVLFFFRGGGERPLRPPLDPPLVNISLRNFVGEGIIK
jgi:hypothetical protein